MPSDQIEPSNASPEIVIRADEEQVPTLAEVSEFLLDLNLLYEVIQLRTNPKYSGYRFNQFTLYRNRHRIEREDQLLVEQLSHESPLVVALGIISVGAVRFVRILAEDISSIFKARIEVIDANETVRAKKIANDAADRDSATRSRLLEGRARRAEALATSAEIANARALADPTFREREIESNNSADDWEDQLFVRRQRLSDDPAEAQRILERRLRRSPIRVTVVELYPGESPENPGDATKPPPDSKRLPPANKKLPPGKKRRR